MPITTLTKHFIYEYALDKLFNNLLKNLVYPTVLKVGTHYNKITWIGGGMGAYDNITCFLYNCFITGCNEFEYKVEFDYGELICPPDLPYGFYTQFTRELMSAGYMLKSEGGKLIITHANGIPIPYVSMSDWSFE